MLALTFADEAPCAEVAALIQRRLEEVKARLRELRRVERALSKARQSCCKGGKDWCQRNRATEGGERPESCRRRDW